MTLENNFINHSKEYIFSDNKILSNQRESTFKKIFQKNYDKKNNESLKNITITDLSKFDYFYKPIKEDPTVLLIKDLILDFTDLGPAEALLLNYYQRLLISLQQLQIIIYIEQIKGFMTELLRLIFHFFLEQIMTFKHTHSLPLILYYLT